MSEALGLLMEMSDISIQLLGGIVGCPLAALALPHALVEWATMVIVTRENARRSKFRVRGQRVQRPRLHQCGRRPARRTRTKPAEHTARARTRFRPARRHSGECDRVGDGGRLLWLSPALPGRIHRIIRICECQRAPVPAGLAYQGAAPWLTTGMKRRPLQGLTPTEKSRN